MTRPSLQVKFVIALAICCFTILVSACDRLDRGESSVQRDLYSICGNIDFEISEHILNSEIYQIRNVTDFQRYRELLESELAYFEQKRETLTECMFETAMNVSEVERNQMMDLNQRITGAVSHLRIILEDRFILEPGCESCTPEQLVFLRNYWFEKTNIFEVGD